jgi:hypothetical protein
MNIRHCPVITRHIKRRTDEKNILSVMDIWSLGDLFSHAIASCSRQRRKIPASSEPSLTPFPTTLPSIHVIMTDSINCFSMGLTQLEL